jgi:hypothetical protein
MMKAKAKTEHKISGQMGHPAAWMRDDKTVPSLGGKVSKEHHYG